MLDLNQVRKHSTNRDQLDKWRDEGRLDVEAGLLSVGVILPRRFDASFIRTQSEWMTGDSREDLYLWFHVDETGDPFYAGRGRGETAWNRNGGVAWEWFVRERLGGNYHVAVLATGLSEENSSALLEQVMEAYGRLLLIQSNMHRGMDYGAQEAFDHAKNAIYPFYKRIEQAHSLEEQADIARKAIELQYALARVNPELGRFGECLRDMGALRAVDGYFITHLVEALVQKGDMEGSRSALDKHLRWAPYLAHKKRIQRLVKIVAGGRFRPSILY